MTKSYHIEDLFQDIPDDPNNVIFQIPPEICQELDWKEGDLINIKAEEGKLTLTKV